VGGKGKVYPKAPIATRGKETVVKRGLEAHARVDNGHTLDMQREASWTNSVEKKRKPRENESSLRELLIKGQRKEKYNSITPSISSAPQAPETEGRDCKPIKEGQGAHSFRSEKRESKTGGK